MKIDRSAAAWLAGFFLAAGLPAAGHTLRLGRATFSFESSSKKLAAALAPKVEAVQMTFNASRRSLRPVQSWGSKPAYLRREVAGLIDTTEKNLDQAIEQIGEPGLDALRAWSREKLRRLQGELAAQPRQAATACPGCPVAVVASLGTLPLASLAAAAPQQDAVAADAADRLLDQAGEVISRLLFLAAHDDLEVTLWVGSTPETRATFRFWPEGRIGGAAPAPAILKTNGSRKRVLRGLYDYSAAWAKGAVTQVVDYPNPAGPAAAQLAGEQLDLVSDSSFFCCRFNEQYCHHVDAEPDCRP